MNPDSKIRLNFNGINKGLFDIKGLNLPSMISLSNPQSIANSVERDIEKINTFKYSGNSFKNASAHKTE